MNRLVLNIWGRELDLEIVFDCYDEEEVLASQKDALAEFIAIGENLINDAQQAVEKYCLERNGSEIGTTVIDNIFRFVMPKSIYIQRTEDESNVVGLMCNYRFDLDDGIVVMFKNLVLEAVGKQDLIL